MGGDQLGAAWLSCQAGRAVQHERLLRSVDRLLSPDGGGGIHPPWPCGHSHSCQRAGYIAGQDGELPAARTHLRDEIDPALIALTGVSRIKMGPMLSHRPRGMFAGGTR